jgi:hypothetical protein
MYQHDERHTGRSEFEGIGHAPVVLWRIPLDTACNGDSGGLSLGSDGTIYAGTCNKLYAIDPVARSVLWTSPFRDNSRSVPAVSNAGVLYWGYGDSLVAVLPDGTSAWQIPNLTGNYVFASSPVIDGNGNIYVSHDWIWSFDANGSFRWAQPGNFGNHVSPALGEDEAMYSLGAHDLAKISSSGTSLWFAHTFGGNTSPSPVVADDGTIYGASFGARLVAINPDGTQKWVFDTDELSRGNWVHSANPVLASDGTIYFAVEGHLYAINPDGTRRWKITLSQNRLMLPIIDTQNRVTTCVYVENRCYGIASNGEIDWTLLPGYASGPTAAYLLPGYIIAGEGIMYILDTSPAIAAWADVTSWDKMYMPLVFR